MKYAFGTAAILAAGLAMPVLAESDITTSVHTDGTFCTSDYSPSTEGNQEEQSKSEFTVMDRDGDGMVSQDEYIECRKAAAGDTSFTNSSDSSQSSSDTSSDSSGSGSSGSTDSHSGNTESNSDSSN